MTTAAPIAESIESLLGAFNDFPGFQTLLRDRIEEIGISRDTLDALVGTSEGHCGKLLADPPAKNMGITMFGEVMKKLAVKALLVEDADQRKKMEPLWLKRVEHNVRHKAIHSGGVDEKIEIKISRRTLRRMAAKGGKARWAKLSERQKRKLALRLNRARWKPKPTTTTKPTKRKAR